jgi:hypothetical protein
VSKLTRPLQLLAKLPRTKSDRRLMLPAELPSYEARHHRRSQKKKKTQARMRGEVRERVTSGREESWRAKMTQIWTFD